MTTYPSKTLVLRGIGPYNEKKMVHHYGLLLTFDFVKNKTEAYLMCVYTLIIISIIFCKFSLIFSFRKFLLPCIG